MFHQANPPCYALWSPPGNWQITCDEHIQQSSMSTSKATISCRRKYWANAILAFQLASLWKMFFLSKININTSCFCLYIWCIITSCIEGNRFVIKQFLPQLLTIWSSHNFFSINLQWSWVDYLFLIYLVILTFKWKFLLHITFLIYLWWRISISAIQRTYTDKIILPKIITNLLLKAMAVAAP